MNQFWPWLVAAGVIILPLASYAAVLLLRLRRVSKAAGGADSQPVEAVGEFVPPSAESRLGARESIRVLARCYLDGQVGGSELCLRLAVLLDQPSLDERLREQGAVFIRVAAELAEVPTHQAWKALSRSERQAYRKQMEQLESDHRDAMRTAAEQLAV